MTDGAVWARVSTHDQETLNQLGVLCAWAERRDVRVVARFVTEDSAWLESKGNGGKGAEFDRARDELLNGARLGKYQVVMIWAIDRLSRKGIEDTLRCMRLLYSYGCDIWSHEEPWLQTSEPHMRELLVSFMAWIAQQESRRRSERVKAGLERRKAQGLPVGRQPGSKAKKKHTRQRKPAAR